MKGGEVVGADEPAASVGVFPASQVASEVLRFETAMKLAEDQVPVAAGGQARAASSSWINPAVIEASPAITVMTTADPCARWPDTPGCRGRQRPPRRHPSRTPAALRPKAP